MKKRTRNMLLFIPAILVFLCAVAGATVYHYLFAPQFHPPGTVFVHIDRDDTADSVYNKVRQYGRADKSRGFLWMSRYKKLSLHIHTGCYAIHGKDNVYHVFNRILRGYQEPVNLTIGSVRTMDRLMQSIGRQLMIDSVEIAGRLSDSVFLEDMGYTRATVPCLFIPDTYQVYWDMSVDDFFQRMRTEHDRFWDEQRRARASAIGMTPEEVCTLASIVEEETNDNNEKPVVAGLYINRLSAGMPLQADPTVKFAMQDFGLRRITNRDLKTESPYNTYLNTGLPPGPIRIPTKKGIDSVLNYTRHNYLYMCAKEDFSGTHNFASNYAGHMANARKYRKALNERKIFK